MEQRVVQNGKLGSFFLAVADFLSWKSKGKIGGRVAL